LTNPGGNSELEPAHPLSDELGNKRCLVVVCMFSHCFPETNTQEFPFADTKNRKHWSIQPNLAQTLGYSKVTSPKKRMNCSGFIKDELSGIPIYQRS